MKLQGEYVFDGPREEVWEIIRDPEVLATALPGTQSLEQVGENEFEGTMHVRIGPVAGVFAGKIVVSDEVPPESCTLTVEGKGAPGFANGTGRVKLIEQGDDQTLLQYEGDMQVGGRLASVGQRLIDTASKSMIAQGLESLNNALKVRMLGEEEGITVEYVPPTEAEFAAAVAKDVAREMLPPAQLVAIVLAAVAAIALLIFLLTRDEEEE
ncbi:MAG: SRPBCC family protein [Anaerolineae bacterium]|jgi:carbon monoxide dehydrogenase subunit G